MLISVSIGSSLTRMEVKSGFWLILSGVHCITNENIRGRWRVPPGGRSRSMGLVSRDGVVGGKTGMAIRSRWGKNES